MSDLVDKINEMIDILQAIDPAAAAKFRGETRNPRADIPQPVKVIPISPPVQTETDHHEEVKAKMHASRRSVSTGPLAGLLDPEQRSERLIEAILYSEIIGKPVSKRRR